MEAHLGLHLRNFNKRVQVMNQTNARELVLSKLEAQNLQSEIFELLAQIADLTKIKKDESAADVITVGMDGGGF